MSKNKRAKQEKKLEETKLPNLSGVKFEDAVKAFMQTPQQPYDKSRMHIFKKKKP